MNDYDGELSKIMSNVSKIQHAYTQCTIARGDVSGVILFYKKLKTAKKQPFMNRDTHSWLPSA
jgi:hypothetical protein